MTNVLPYFIAGVLAGVLFTGFAAALLLLRRQKAAAELESQLRSHSFELQITLDELADKNQLLLAQTQLDALSGIYNRSYFDQQMRSELKRSRREQRSLALVLLDIDHFKHINDKHGHLAGDQAIKFVAQLIRQQLKRPADKVCRYGGEEFALILPNTGLPGAQQLAEQIRQQLSQSTLTVSEHHFSLNISAGCYAAVPGTQSDNDEFIALADLALYRAKAAGRNQVHGYPPNSASTAETVTGEVNEH
ncbi:GGDEF domain-containing protein [Rheinheimera pleomorphica]|uniref:GGDEF domain-containing protein n=1 Tax=Rheinheimera pleomorphica TaxID=2703963 RepID=UPI00141E5057|nr:GGDEF domain-containing protein [Rheinheimera pleomorphica]